MRIKFPYGSTAENNQLLLPEGYLSVDLEKKALRLHDGATQGGFEVLGERAYNPIPGKNFRSATLNTNGFNRVTFGNGVYVGINGTGIYSSTNGVNFTLRHTAAQNLTDVVFIDSVFTASGGRGTLLTSANGTSWTARAVGFTGSPNITSVSGTTVVRSPVGNRLIAFAFGTQNQSTSLDGGATWVSVTTNGISTTSGQKSAYGNGIYVMWGTGINIFTNTNGGGNWTSTSLAALLGTSRICQGIVFNNGWFYWYGSVNNIAKLFRSTNGTSWVDCTPTAVTSHLQIINIAFVGTRLTIITFPPTGSVFRAYTTTNIATVGSWEEITVNMATGGILSSPTALTGNAAGTSMIIYPPTNNNTVYVSP